MGDCENILFDWSWLGVIGGDWGWLGEIAHFSKAPYGVMGRNWPITG